MHSLPAPERKPSVFRIVAVSRIYNEEDIIEAFVRHHASMVDHHVLLDNGSIDRSIDILRLLAKEGYSLTVLQNHSVSFSQEEHNTMLYRIAVKEHAADWVLFLDADEFLSKNPVRLQLMDLDDHSQFDWRNNVLKQSKLEYVDPPLKQYFSEQLLALPSAGVCCRIGMVNYHVSVEDDPKDALVPRRIQMCDREPLNVFKCFVRRVRNIESLTIEAGNHAVRFEERLREGPLLLGLMLAHYHTRHPLRRIAGALIGCLKVIAAGEEQLNQDRSVHYVSFLDKMLRNPRLLLDDEDFMKSQNHGRELVRGSIDYLGLPLRYTTLDDGLARTLKILCNYAAALAYSHGALLSGTSVQREKVTIDKNKFVLLIDSSKE